MKTKKESVSHAEENAKNWLESIKDMIERYDDAKDGMEEDIREEIQESILDLSVRDDWHQPGESEKINKPIEYLILLTTGGPALRIIGDLSEHGEPETARLQYQDWGTPWTEYRTTGDGNRLLLQFASFFYFGE